MNYFLWWSRWFSFSFSVSIYLWSNDTFHGKTNLFFLKTKTNNSRLASILVSNLVKRILRHSFSHFLFKNLFRFILAVFLEVFLSIWTMNLENRSEWIFSSTNFNDSHIKIQLCRMFNSDWTTKFTIKTKNGIVWCDDWQWFSYRWNVTISKYFQMKLSMSVESPFVERLRNSSFDWTRILDANSYTNNNKSHWNGRLANTLRLETVTSKIRIERIVTRW